MRPAAVALGLALLSGPAWAFGGDIPYCCEVWHYRGGEVVFTYAPTGERVTAGDVSATYFPEGHNGAERPRIVVTVDAGPSTRRERHPEYGIWILHYRLIHDHRTPWMGVGPDGRFSTDRLSLSYPRTYEPARLEGRLTDRGRLLTGSFESRLIRGTFRVEGLPQSEARERARRRR